MKTGQALILNKHYFPVGVNSHHNVFRNIASGTQAALDITYKTNDDGTPDFENIEFWSVVPTLDEWMELPVRSFDQSIGTTRGPVRLPTVVVCSSFKGIAYRKAQFPTKKNIWERDKYTCVYTGKKLSKEELSVDHVYPKSKGGQDTWDNLVTCDKQLNSDKSNKLLSETKLKLRYKPYKPKDGFKFDIYRDEWYSFLANF
jgi:5-methylcytosine-specific restriction endonuclease McrA